MGLYGWARMARFIPTQLRASPDILDKDTAERVGREIAAERAAAVLNFLLLTTSFRDEARKGSHRHGSYSCSPI
jgi:hypothetical protein